MDIAYNMFIKNLKSKQSIITTNIGKLRTILLSEDVKQKLQASQSIEQTCRDLMQMCGPDTPEWVKQLQLLTRDFIGKQNNLQTKVNLMNYIIDSSDDIRNHDWQIGGFNYDLSFENIYRQYKRESHLPDLFDELIEQIETLLQDEEIDLQDAERKISFLLSIVKSNLNKSMYGDQSVLSYLTYFIKEFMLNLCGTIPGLREFVEAIIATAKKINDELVVTREKTEKRICDQLNLKSLPQYDNQGKYLEQIEDHFCNIEI